MEVLARILQRTMPLRSALPDRCHAAVVVLPQSRLFFDLKAAKEEQRQQELKVISAKEHFEWGYNVLQLPEYNKGMAFGIEERQKLRIHGMLPPRVMTPKAQVDRLMVRCRTAPADIDRFSLMMSWRDRNEKLFYRTISENVAYFLPIIYTPTVGQACIEYGLYYTRPRGIFISIHDRGHVRTILQNWPFVNIKAIVVTDGERILGLGDLGAYGMGIPVGKLALYTALAGVQPSECLPVTIDVGTNSHKILDDPFYIGIPQLRITGPAYDDLIDEFMEACTTVFGQNVLIQFEDFAYHNAYRLITKYQYKYCTFNDDIMGTASVAVSGIFASLRITQKPLTENLFFFLGAGSASLGIARLLKMALVEDGLTDEEAKARIWMFDMGGLLTCDRPTGGVDEQTQPFCHVYKHMDNLEEAIKELNPSVLIGASTVGGAFTPAILQHMAKVNDRPVIFALSNPTSRAECTAEAAYTETQGRCVFCSGSPFDPVEIDGKRFESGQGNNAYIFPGVALAVIFGMIRHIPDSYFLLAARVLAEQVEEADLEIGRVYPPLDDIIEISKIIGVKVIERAYEDGLATLYPRPVYLKEYITYRQYNLDYNTFLPKTWPWPDTKY